MKISSFYSGLERLFILEQDNKVKELNKKIKHTEKI